MCSFWTLLGENYITIPYNLVNMQLERAARVDVGGIQHFRQLKGVYPGEEGCAERCQVKLDYPGRWMDFLCDPNNKKELFAFIRCKVANFKFQPGKNYSGESQTLQHDMPQPSWGDLFSLLNHAHNSINEFCSQLAAQIRLC